MNKQQRASRTRNDELDRLKLKGSKFVRLHTSGDFFKQDANAEGGYALDADYLDAIIAWARENSDVTIWTYTHDVRKMVSAGYSYKAGSFPSNVHICASVDSLADREFAKSHGFRTARVVKEKTDKVCGETFCPFDLALKDGIKPKTTCAKCTLCFNKNHAHDIAFLEH